MNEILENKIEYPESKEEQFKDGGQLTAEHEKLYKEWKSLVNMSKSELEKFYNSVEGKVAGLSLKEAKELGIHSISFDDSKDIHVLLYVKNNEMFRWDMHGNVISHPMIFDIDRINFPVELP